MKKLFFTAVAVLAFNGVGFAEGKEIKNVDVKLATMPDCHAFGIAMANAYEALDEGDCWSSSDFNLFAGYWSGLCATGYNRSSINIPIKKV